jgi:arylsulfatase A-like enzyme
MEIRSAGKLALPILLALLALIQACQKEPDKPNVIFFALDDMNDWIAPLGDIQAKTPNMERLANSGIMFTNAHAPGTYCAPSRSALWTGLQASTTGCYEYELYQYDYPDLVPLQMAFKEAGYNTYGAGKLFHHGDWHLDLRGWDEYYTRNQEHRDNGYNMGYHGDDLPVPDPKPNSPFYTEWDNPRKNSGFLDWAELPDELEDEMLEVKRTRFACEVLGRNHEQPFFLALGLYTPHYPNYVQKKYFDLYDVDEIRLPEVKEGDWEDLPPAQRTRMMNRDKIRQTLIEIGAYEEAVRAYLAAVSYADAMLGRLLDALEESEYKDNTIVILWSDQGYHLGEKGNWGKHTLWQETSHVPLIIAGPGIPAGVNVDATVGLIDLYPTLIDYCILKQQHEMDGISLAPVLRDPSSARDRDLLVPYHERGSYSVINSNWRYIQYNDGGEELYNLKDDPNEWYNLAGQEEYRSVMEKLQKAAPEAFAPQGTPKNELKVVVEGDSFHWEKKTNGE